MPLHPTSPSRERILSVGGYGSGKSNNWIRIAQWCKTTGSDAKFYNLNTDFSIERDLEGWDSSNVEARSVVDYEELVNTGNSYKKKAKRDDWLILDLASDIIGMCQDQVARIESGGKDMSEWALTATKQDMAGDYGSTWGKINGIYQNFMVKNVLAWPGHVYACCQGKEFMRDKNGGIIGSVDSETKELFGKFNVKPEGKNLPRYFHSVLVMQKAKEKDWRLNTIRERVPQGVPGRPALSNLQVKDFVLDYLIPVAGWEVEEIWKQAGIG